MKTRSKKGAASKSQDKTIPSTTLPTLEPSIENPPQVFILPTDASPSARIITLPNPATLAPTRYFADPKHGFYEFARVAAPKKSCRSWLLSPEAEEADAETAEQGDEGYVLQTPDLLIATPIDPLFIVLPALWPNDDGTGGQDWGTLHDRLFLDGASTDDEAREGRYGHLQTMLKSSGGRALEKMIEKRMKAVCNVIETGPDEDDSFTMILGMFGTEMINKAMKMVKAGLPASLEEHFVKKALEMPELSIRREESSVSIVNEDAMPGASESQESATSASAGTSQNTDSSAATATCTSTVATELTVTPVQHSRTPVATDISHLLRLRTALNFLLTSYTPPDLRSQLQSVFTSHHNKVIDFTPLDKHLAHIAKLKSEAQALRSISDNISRKRGTLDDDEVVEKTEAKKRKKEEEEAKKKNVSLGVRKLGKVDTSGMKKMSSFFQKTPAKKT